MGIKWFVSVLIIYPRDCVADGQLQLTATAQYHKSIWYCMLLKEKIKIFKSKYYLYWISIIFAPL